MTRSSIARRIVRRCLASGDPIVASDTLLTSDNVEALLAGRDLDVRNLVFFAVPDLDGGNAVRWTGVDESGELLRGIVRVQVRHDVHAVSASLLVDVDTRRAGNGERAASAKTTNERLALIRATARQAIRELRAEPKNRRDAIEHFARIYDLAEPTATDERPSAVLTTHPT